jgi:hypothetical protein
MARTKAGMAALFLALVAAGCAGLGERVGQTMLPEGAPPAEDVLRDLAENDARIQSFRSGGTVLIISPEFDGARRFRGGIRFRRPDYLYVQGNQRFTNVPVFKLVCVGQEFLMEFPGSRDQSFYQVEGETFEDVPFSVSPSDIAREMFLPEDWSALKRRDARVTAYDPGTAMATLSIGAENRARRIIEVIQVNDADPRWVIQKNTRLTNEGEILAVTTSDEYTTVDGALFPTSVDALFPTEETRMTFTMRSVRLNVDVQDENFDIRARAEELQLTERRAQQ